MSGLAWGTVVSLRGSGAAAGWAGLVCQSSTEVSPSLSVCLRVRVRMCHEETTVTGRRVTKEAPLPLALRDRAFIGSRAVRRTAV